MHARLALRFEKPLNSDRTVVRLVEQQPPWKLVRAFPTEAGGSLVHLNNLSGGILGGDRLELQVQLSPGAIGQITSTGATRVYRSRPDTPAAGCDAQISLAENSSLELLPDVLIPFADSSFNQSTSIHLAAGASLFWWEVVAPGREARGEIFQYRSLHLQSQLCAEGVPFAMERFQLEPARRRLDSLARLGSDRYLATFFVCRVIENIDCWRVLEQKLAEITTRCTQSDQVRWGVSTLARHGVVIRGVGRGSRAIWRGLYEFWRTAKLALLGQEAVLPRKTY